MGERRMLITVIDYSRSSGVDHSGFASIEVERRNKAEVRVNEQDPIACVRLSDNGKRFHADNARSSRGHCSSIGSRRPREYGYVIADECHHPFHAVRPIRFNLSAREAAERSPFRHVVSPRLTTFQMLPGCLRRSELR